MSAVRKKKPDEGRASTERKSKKTSPRREASRPEDIDYDTVYDEVTKTYPNIVARLAE